jgi:uncharacterized protein
VRGELEDHEATSSGAPGTVSVRLSRSGKDIVLRGHLTAELQAPCARCLKPFNFTVDKDLTGLLVLESSVTTTPSDDEDAELSPDELDVMTYDGECVVLDALIHDELVLETPMIPLCAEDCEGVPAPKDAAPETPAIDPRLAPLMAFKPAKR